MDIVFGVAFSLHFGFNESYNQFHPHVRLQEDHFVAGMYYNSIENLSTYAGYKYEYEDVGIEIGLVTGYDFEDTPVAPYVRATYKDFFTAPILIGNDTGVVTGYELNF